MDEPTKLKHYEILSRIGEGGMGVVYRARDTRLGRIVALKLLPKELAEDEDRSRRFEREARIASAITHPGIATLYDVDRDEGIAFLTMELVEGVTLRQLLEQGPLPLAQLLDCALQVAEALAAAHQEGVTHRDLKPENIMAARSGYYKVLDFGVARFDKQEPSAGPSPTSTPTRTWATHAGAVIGTVTYMSPEQALGEAVDARSDVFSFGSLLHELATGRPAFHGANEIATAQAITSRDPEPIREQRPEIPEGFERVVRKCLAKQPDDRYPSAVELASDLRIVRSRAVSGTTTRDRLLAESLPSATRQRRWWAAAAVAVLALAGAGAWWLLSGAAVDPPEQAASVGAGAALAERGPGASPDPPPLPAAGLPDRPRVVVAFFENNTGDAELEWLVRGLPEMLTTDLSRSEDLEVIATQKLYDLLAASGDVERRDLDRSTATGLARWAGAQMVISGSVFRVGDQYRLDAQAYDTSTGAVVVAHKVEGEDLFRMVDELTAELRRGLRVDQQPLEAPLKAALTSSEEAYRHFVRGKAHYESLRFMEAAAEFKQALSLDSAFALARLRLILSLDMAGERDAALAMSDRLAADLDRLPERERLLAGAFRAFFKDGDVRAGRALVEELLERYPASDEVFIWWSRGLADVAGDPLRATLTLRKAIERDPNNLPAVLLLSTQLAELGATEDARLLLQQTIARNPNAAAELRRRLKALG